MHGQPLYNSGSVSGLDNGLSPSHYLNQRWPSLLTLICAIRPGGVKPNVGLVNLLNKRDLWLLLLTWINFNPSMDK